MERWKRLYDDCAKGPRNVRWDDLVRLMDEAGFDCRMTKSGHGALFSHRVYEIRVSAARPHRHHVLETYVRDCLHAIDEVQYLEDESDA